MGGRGANAGGISANLAEFIVGGGGTIGGVTLTKQEEAYMKKHGISVNTGGAPAGPEGLYDTSNKEITLKPDASAATFWHEFGHSVQDNAASPMQDADYNRLFHSKKSQTTKMIYKRAPEMESIINGRNSSTEGNRRYRTFKDYHKYISAPGEVFADGYRVFKQDPTWLKSNAPDYYKLYKSIKI